MAVIPPDEEERLAYCEWLTANGIDYNTVPRYDHQLRIEEHDGQRTICYVHFVYTDDGHTQADPDKPDEALKQPASAPCRVEPPAWLHVPGGAT